MIKCRDFEVLKKIIELRSFSKAADDLSLTQPTLSGHMIDLEKRLGMKLLDRLGKEIRPTKAGMILYEYAKKVLKIRDEAEQALEEFKGGLKGNLVVGGSSIPGVYILPGIIERFKRKFPQTSITLKLSDSKGTLESLLDGVIEIGVIGAKIPDNKVEYKKFYDDEIILARSKGKGWAKKDPVSLNDLKTEPLILRERGSGTRITTEKSLQVQRVNINEFNIVAEMENTEAIKQGIKCGLGASFISKRAIEDELKKGEISEVKVKNLKITRVFYVITRKGSTLSPLCAHFLDFLLKLS